MPAAASRVSAPLRFLLLGNPRHGLAREEKDKLDLGIPIPGRTTGQVSPIRGRTDPGAPGRIFHHIHIAANDARRQLRAATAETLASELGRSTAGDSIIA